MINHQQPPWLTVPLVVPGIKLEETKPLRQGVQPFRPGVPVFLGYAKKKKSDSERENESESERNKPQRLTDWSQFEQNFDKQEESSFLALAVRGFFENGGQICYVVELDDDLTPVESLESLESLGIEDAIDLVCAPDIYRKSESSEKWDLAAAQAMQKAILDYCDRQGNLFAILDALLDADVLEQRKELGSRKNGALYYPWVLVPDQKGNIWVPPCGHLAGIYARSDVHKAPANEELSGVQDLGVPPTDKKIKQFTHKDISLLNPEGINCLRAFPGRGIRVWGARTLSQEPNWRYVNVRRLFLTVARWLERFMIKITFEPNDERLRARIVRELTFYFEQLFLKGALRGASAEEAFYVKCDAENNPRDVSDAGIVVTEIGLAPTIPSEFIVVRITHNESGTSIASG